MEDETSKLTQGQSDEERVASVLWSFETFELLEELLQEQNVTDPKVSKVTAGMLKMVEGMVDAQDFLAALQEDFRLDEARARELAVQVGQKILLPLKDDLPFSLDAYMDQWGGAGAEVLPELYVKAYVSALPDVKQARLARRLEDIFLDYIAGRTDRAAAIERLSHSVKLDGLGLSQEGAQALLADLEKDRKEKGLDEQKEEGAQEVAPTGAEVILEEEPVVLSAPEKVQEKIEQPVEIPAPVPTQVQQVPEPTKIPEEVTSPQPVVTKESEEELDKKEVEQIAKEQSHVVQTSELVTPEAIVAKICQKDPFKFDDPLLEGRCKKIVESRVRGVRDARGAMVTLERAVEKGGLGVKGRRLADIMEALEAEVQAYERSHEGKMAVRKQEHVQERIARREKKTEQAKKQQQHLAKRYADLTGKAPVAGVAPVAPPVSRTSAAVSAHHEMREREGKIDAGRVKAAIESAKAPVPKPHGTPSMKEITFEKRLSGPVDELQTLDLTDFRRLSSDPTQAATKLKDKVDLIEDQQGHAEKIAAIDAWRTSPLHKMYVDLTREAVLAGVPVTQVLEQHRTAGEETLSDEELAAIMHVNSELRF